MVAILFLEIFWIPQHILSISKTNKRQIRSIFICKIFGRLIDHLNRQNPFVGISLRIFGHVWRMVVIIRLQYLIVDNCLWECVLFEYQWHRSHKFHFWKHTFYRIQEWAGCKQADSWFVASTCQCPCPDGLGLYLVADTISWPDSIILPIRRWILDESL